MGSLERQRRADHNYAPMYTYNMCSNGDLYMICISYSPHFVHYVLFYGMVLGAGVATPAVAARLASSPEGRAVVATARTGRWGWSRRRVRAKTQNGLQVELLCRGVCDTMSAKCGKRLYW